MPLFLCKLRIEVGKKKGAENIEKYLPQIVFVCIAALIHRKNGTLFMIKCNKYVVWCQNIRDIVEKSIMIQVYVCAVQPFMQSKR